MISICKLERNIVSFMHNQLCRTMIVLVIERLFDCLVSLFLSVIWMLNVCIFVSDFVLSVILQNHSLSDLFIDVKQINEINVQWSLGEDLKCIGAQ